MAVTGRKGHLQSKQLWKALVRYSKFHFVIQGRNVSLLIPLIIVNDIWLFKADQLHEVIKFSKFLFQEESSFWQNTENLICFCLKFLVITLAELLMASKNNFSTANFIIISFLEAIHALCTMLMF
jgi:hypothetical protein